MKKITSLCMLLSFLALTAQTNYELAVSTETYVNLENPISLNNGEVWDDPGYTIPIGFDFELGSLTVDTIFFPEDGVGGIVTTDSNLDALSVGAFGAVIQDIIDRGDISGNSVSPLSYELSGDVGSQILKIEWNNVGFFEDDDLNDFMNFQLWLYEGSNDIEYRYGPNSINNPQGSFEGLAGLQVGLFPLLPEGDGGPLLEDGYILSGDPLNPEFIILATEEEFNNAEGTSLTGAVPDGTVYRFSSEELALSDVFALDLKLYPNPTSDSFKIDSVDENFIVEVYSLTGQKIITFQGEERVYDISELSSGVYFINIQSQGGLVTRRLVKN